MHMSAMNNVSKKQKLTNEKVLFIGNSVQKSSPDHLFSFQYGILLNPLKREWHLQVIQYSLFVLFVIVS